MREASAEPVLSKLGYLWTNRFKDPGDPDSLAARIGKAIRTSLTHASNPQQAMTPMDWNQWVASGLSQEQHSTADSHRQPQATPNTARPQPRTPTSAQTGRANRLEPSISKNGPSTSTNTLQHWATSAQPSNISPPTSGRSLEGSAATQPPPMEQLQPQSTDSAHT